jgi:hypothetical protein
MSLLSWWLTTTVLGIGLGLLSLWSVGLACGLVIGWVAGDVWRASRSWRVALLNKL